MLNWEKHNPDRNGKRMPWFRMSTDYLTDEKIRGLSLSEKHIFMGLLCMCSDKGSAEFVVNYNHLSTRLVQRGVNLRTGLLQLRDNLLIEVDENIDEKKYQSDKRREEKRRREEIRVEREQPIPIKSVKQFINSGLKNKELPAGVKEEDIAF